MRGLLEDSGGNCRISPGTTYTGVLSTYCSYLAGYRGRYSLAYSLLAVVFD